MKVRDKADEIFLQSLGNRIVTIRKGKGMTQRELSYRCDIENSNMRRIEAGNTNITVLMLKKIAAGLETNVRELMDFFND
jgi:transcriptional regulator with XRE-family HTH domain